QRNLGPDVDFPEVDRPDGDRVDVVDRLAGGRHQDGIPGEGVAQLLDREAAGDVDKLDLEVQRAGLIDRDGDGDGIVVILEVLALDDRTGGVVELDGAGSGQRLGQFPL